MATGATELAERFKKEATRAGAVVYEARDANDASSYVLKLAHEHNVKHAVKSSSTLVQEIGLREHLENAGIEVKETDIGKWLAQLAGEGPVHVPESAKTIEQAADLVARATGEKLSPDPQVLLNAARRALRQSYIDADMGISEASVGIAETGTLVIISNEGNARLVAILPPIHVTMIDCENLVSTMEDAAVRLKSLSKNVTGHKMPGYITYITGRNTTGDIPGALMARAQGPEEEHIVLRGLT